MRFIIFFLLVSCNTNGQGYLGRIASGSITPPVVSTNYYVDSVSGNDSNTGSISSPFKTVAKINTLTLAAGSIVNFQGGQTFPGMLILTESGTSGSPITIQSYGTGQATIYGDDTTGILLQNCEYITINNLNVQGSGVDTSGYTTNTGYGIIASSTSAVAGYYNNIIIDSCLVDGFRWGMYFVATSSGTWRGYNGITLTNNEVKFCAHTGIRTNSNNPNSLNTVHKNIYMYRNYVHDMYGNPLASTSWDNANYGTGIRLNFMDSGIVEKNRVDNCGHSGSVWGTPANFEAENASNITWQNNESSRCMISTDFVSDGAGFDVWDGDCQNMIVQYNYIHDNQGYGLGGGNGGYGSPNTGNIGRFNLLVNNNKKGQTADISIWAEQTGLKLYNNTIYSNINYTVLIKIVANTGVVVANNIFVHTGANSYMHIADTTTKILNNSYWVNNSATNLTFRIGCCWFYTLDQLHASVYEKYSGVDYGFAGKPTFVNQGDTTSFLMGQNVSAQNAYNITGVGAGGYVDFSALTGNVGTKDFHNTTITIPVNIGAMQ